MGNETLSKYFRTHDNESRQTEFVNEIDEDEFVGDHHQTSFQPSFIEFLSVPIECEVIDLSNAAELDSSDRDNREKLNNDKKISMESESNEKL